MKICNRNIFRRHRQKLWYTAAGAPLSEEQVEGCHRCQGEGGTADESVKPVRIMGYLFGVFTTREGGGSF